MVLLKPDNLKVPLIVRVGKITDETIYFSGEHFEWCKTDFTPVLKDDLTSILGSEDSILWFGEKIEIFSADGNLRARLLESKVQDGSI